MRWLLHWKTFRRCIIANYSVNITDNGDGSFTLTSVLRAPSTAASGGTSLLTNTFTQSASTGAVSAISGFLVGATTTTDGLGHVLRSPAECAQRAITLINSDRAFNG